VDRFIKGVSGPAPLTARDVAELTGWKHECVTHWCKEGLLKSSQERRGGADTYFIRHQDLVEFQKRFVVVSDFAKSAGTLSKHIIARASGTGVQTQGSKMSGSASRCHVLEILSPVNIIRFAFSGPSRCTHIAVVGHPQTRVGM